MATTPTTSQVTSASGTVATVTVMPTAVAATAIPTVPTAAPNTSVVPSDLERTQRWLDTYASLAGDNPAQIRQQIFGAGGSAFNRGAFTSYVSDPARRQRVNAQLNDPASYARLSNDQKNSLSELYHYLGYYDSAETQSAAEAARAAELARSHDQAAAQAAADRTRDERLRSAGQDYLADNGGNADIGQQLIDFIKEFLSQVFGIDFDGMTQQRRRELADAGDTPDQVRRSSGGSRNTGNFYGGRGGSDPRSVPLPQRPNFDAAPRVSVRDIIGGSGSDSERIAAYASAHNMDARRLQNSVLHTVDSLSTLHPQMRATGVMAVRKLFADGHPVYIEEGWRDPARQTALVRGGASRAGPGMSFHNYGLAVDARPMRGTSVADIRRVFDDMYGTASIGDWDPDHHQFLHGIGNIRHLQVDPATRYVVIPEGMTDRRMRVATAQWHIELASQGRLHGQPQQAVARNDHPHPPAHVRQAANQAAGSHPRLPVHEVHGAVHASGGVVATVFNMAHAAMGSILRG